MHPNSFADADYKSEDVVLPQDVSERVLGCTGSITMLPQHAVKALVQLDDPDISAACVSDVIEQDVMLATDILAIANTVTFSSGKSIANLTQAITRVGARRCKSIIVASSMKASMQEIDLNEHWIKEVLTRHGFLTAVLASNLNRRLGCGFQGEEFAAGLIHDFGRLLLAVSYPKSFPEFDPLDFNESNGLLKKEEDAIGANHCDVGAWFMFRQLLPQALCDVVRYHHNPMESKNNPRLAALIACADHLANHYQRFADTEVYDPGTNPNFLLLEKLGVADACANFADIADELISESAADANNFANS